MPQVAQRVALVTGCGGPSGIGFASARALAESGMAVAISSTTERIADRVTELVAEGHEASRSSSTARTASRSCAPFRKATRHSSTASIRSTERGVGTGPARFNAPVPPLVVHMAPAIAN